jgi:hypothetical protein
MAQFENRPQRLGSPPTPRWLLDEVRALLLRGGAEYTVGRVVTVLR